MCIRDRFQSFGKIKSNTNHGDKVLTELIKRKSSGILKDQQIDEQIAERTMEVKANRLEKEIGEIKKTGNRATSIFKLAEKVNGPKKTGCWLL